MQRKHIAAAIVTAVGAAAIACIAAGGSGISAKNVSDVSDFLTKNGITAVYAYEKEVTIPEDFGEVYENYNKLQREQGFDLVKHKGHAAVAYTFFVTGYTDENGETLSNVEAHVLVCDGKIVGADVASTRLDGFMRGVISG